ncbi:MAG: malto-oligosyltrehalose trehalohydrolase [Pirellulaceae bacterium]
MKYPTQNKTHQSTVKAAQRHTQLGAIVTATQTRFRVWAPDHSQLTLELVRPQLASSAPGQAVAPELYPMSSAADGYYELELPEPLTGCTYQYVFPDGRKRPDLSSRFQPAGVHGPSQVVDPSRYSWRDQQWQGVAKSDLIIYELHLGAFTEAGTYQAACERLPQLKELGITAIELMPLAESAGNWNWGYDGVQFFAPQHTYGTPDDFRHLVDTAHQLGLAVLLDVVYNHVGPEGNYFRDFGPSISEKHSTAWGDAPNFDSHDTATSAAVRDYFLANVSYWIDEFHLDGLRVDAIHCMADESSPHIVTEIAETFCSLRERTSWHLHLIAESNVYDARMLQPLDGGGHGYDAQWCDDFLHSVFAVLRPGEQMSQRVYHGEDLQSTLHRGYIFAGSLSMPRQRISLEEDPHRADLTSLVFSIQNHDFIGNHPLGQRLHNLTSHDAHRAAATLLLLYPAIPMLFMGEEFASPHPFYFFVDYSDPRMREAVERGRRAEYPQHDWSGGASPLSPTAFHASKIGPAAEGNAQTLAWYQKLIALRKEWRELGLVTADTLHSHWLTDQQTAVLHYRSGNNERFVVARLSSRVMQHAPLTMRFDGEVELSQNCDVDSATGELTVHENGSAIGRGRVNTIGG